MKILHVSLGRPKDHKGGLNRYCNEIMQEQKKAGHEVYLLYPGKVGVFGETKIKKCNDNEFYIENALPVAITYGIDSPVRYRSSCNEDVFREWLQELKPCVIHVHSIQGIHLEFFQAAKKLCIPMMFTTHDYYPICFRCTLVKNTGDLCSGRNPEQCAKCNYKAGLSSIKQYLIQSKLYQKIRKNWLITALRKKSVAHIAERDLSETDLPTPSAGCIEAFRSLGAYYDAILDCFTVIHANSPRTCEVYRNFRPELNYQTIPITHGGLTRTTHTRKINAPIRFGYMGGMNIRKGYGLYQTALTLLDKAGKTDWEAWYYGGDYVPTEQEKQDPRRHYCGYFTAEQEQKVWDTIDVLLVPCVWGETFGFVVLEALCHGVPVICSGLAGSKYLVEQIQPNLVFPYYEPETLRDKMIWLMDENNYADTKKRVDNADLPIDMGEHCKQILDLYRKLITVSNDT